MSEAPSAANDDENVAPESAGSEEPSETSSVTGWSQQDSVRKFDFYSLPRPVQERFIAGARAQGAPTPIGFRKAVHHASILWFVGAGVLAIATLVFASVGFGDLTHTLALGPAYTAVIYAVGLGGALACLLNGLAAKERIASLPYRTGTYLFPVGVIEAHSSTLVLHYLSGLADAEAGEGQLKIRFRDGRSFEFPANDLEQANKAKTLLTRASEMLAAAEATQSRRDLAMLDPLRDNGFSSPFSPRAPLVRNPPAWAKLRLPTAAAGGVVLAIGTWQARNTLSERQIYSEAKELNTTAAYEDYLARGGKRSNVSDTLLPRAKLADAVASGTVEAIQQFIDKNPGSKVESEARQALEQALLSALEQAKQSGTIAALERLQTRYPQAKMIEKEIADARHAVFTNAIERVRPQLRGPEDDLDAQGFFARLVDYSEKHGPQVVIQFRRVVPEAIRRADNQIRLSAYFTGPKCLPSQYFGPEPARKREAKAAEALIKRLNQLFPAEVLRFSQGSSLDAQESGTALPEFKQPTLFIEHVTEVSGGYMNPKPRAIFVGAGLLYRVTFFIPDGGETLTFKHSSWRPPDLEVYRREGAEIADVYDALANDGFEQFIAKFQDALFAG